MGEHLPCKQGVMSSNLTISTRYGFIPNMHIENFTLKEIIKKMKERTIMLARVNVVGQTSKMKQTCKAATLGSGKSEELDTGQADKSAGWMPWH